MIDDKQSYKDKVEALIERVEKQIDRKENIKEDLSYLESIYDYFKDEEPEMVDVISILDENLPRFRDYLDKYLVSKKKNSDRKRTENLRLEKMNEYKAAWGKQSLLFKLINRKRNPSKIKTDDIDILEENICYLNEKSK